MPDEETEAQVEAGLSLLDNLQPLIETVRGAVAAFRAEGFTDREAHEIVTRLFTHREED